MHSELWALNNYSHKDVGNYVKGIDIYCGVVMVWSARRMRLVDEENKSSRWGEVSNGCAKVGNIVFFF